MGCYSGCEWVGDCQELREESMKRKRCFRMKEHIWFCRVPSSFCLPFFYNPTIFLVYSEPIVCACKEFNSYVPKIKQFSFHMLIFCTSWSWFYQNIMQWAKFIRKWKYQTCSVMVQKFLKEWDTPIFDDGWKYWCCNWKQSISGVAHNTRK